jgi:hypothetical protein
MMRGYISQVAIDGNVRTINDIRQLPDSKFFTWMTDPDYDIGRMHGRSIVKFMKHSNHANI